MSLTTRYGLSGNALKIIAIISMTLDHIGYHLFPGCHLLRILGRLALPIFAYMIAEGCHHTRNPRKYLLTILAVAALCQLVYFFAMGSLYQCILVTFVLSILLIQSMDRARQDESHQTALTTALVWAGVVFVCVGLPQLLDHTDFAIDYGLWGVLLPVFIYLGRDRREKLLLTAVGLILLALSFFGLTQWFSLAALPLLALYNGERGKWRMKYFFYVYYPIHLAVIYGISLIL
ncbi:MAG: hypothetical protein IKK50_08270 [Ruminiclostridium sp.]|nr:hypothetical protein [Ruminiclostridium sp.]